MVTRSSTFIKDASREHSDKDVLQFDTKALRDEALEHMDDIL